ncbi:reverse transcriptase domain-containing protein [Tanacetum coccineum]
MPLHIGTYDGLRDPNNFLHLFKGGNKDAKVGSCTLWLPMYVFTYTLRETSARCLVDIAQKPGNIVNSTDLKSKIQFGYFINDEKDLAFQLVQNYATNTWSKFGFQKLMKNDDGVFLFKFSSKSGMEQVLERGPWMIYKSPIILNKWSPSLSSKKGKVTKVPVWVKMHNVLLLAYSDVGPSLIATQIGKPIMLDAFTSCMCVESWGRIGFARALIEVSSDSYLKKEVIMAIPNKKGNGYIKEITKVEYEWNPPHCVECKSFGHGPITCPNHVKEDVPKALSMVANKPSPMEDQEEGFVEVKGQNKKGTTGPNQHRQISGIKLSKRNLTSIITSSLNKARIRMNDIRVLSK